VLTIRIIGGKRGTKGRKEKMREMEWWRFLSILVVADEK